VVKLLNPLVISGFRREVIGPETSAKNYNFSLLINP